MDASRARDEIEQVQHQIEEQVRRGVDRTRGAVGSLNKQLEGFVQEAPVLAIGGAFVVGYLLAKLARAAR